MPETYESASLEFRETGSEGGAQVGSGCVHEWGPEYHTHLGHERFGAHSAHWDCVTCGATKNHSFSKHSESVYDAPYMKGRMKADALPDPHECFAGWRGVTVYHAWFTGGERQPLSLHIETDDFARWKDGAPKFGAPPDGLPVMPPQRSWLRRLLQHRKGA